MLSELQAHLLVARLRFKADRYRNFGAVPDNRPQMKYTKANAVTN